MESDNIPKAKVETPLSILGYLGVVDKLQLLKSQPLKCMLFTNDYKPNLAEEASIHTISQYELTDSKYPKGGILLENLVVEPLGNGYGIICNDIVFEEADFASYYGVIYNANDSQILSILSFVDNEDNPRLIQASNAPLTIQPDGSAFVIFTINNSCPGGV